MCAALALGCDGGLGFELGASSSGVELLPFVTGTWAAAVGARTGNLLCGVTVVAGGSSSTRGVEGDGGDNTCCGGSTTPAP